MKLLQSFQVSLLLATTVWFNDASALERFVSPAGGHVSPFTDWLSAATNIQAAIDVAVSGDVVTVTNGVYDGGGKVKSGDLTNRIAIDKPITVQSVNGPKVTIIQGTWDPVATNGPGAVRCAWLTNGAVLRGFTLRGGATRGSSGILPPNISSTNSGGGLWSTSVNSIATNCIIIGNAASVRGGGVFSNTVLNSIIYGNVIISSSDVPFGGGAYGATLKNCVVLSNRIISASSGASGGGVSSGALTNCSVVGNFARNGGGVTTDGATVPVINCIVVSNSAASSQTNYSGSLLFGYTCTTPLPAGTGNIATNAQLILDNYHISYTSPCRGAGRPASATGTDIDGQPWSSPPSMGCDENAGEPFVITPPRLAPGPMGQLQFVGADVTGINPFSFFWLQDGNVLSGSRYSGLGTSQLFINGFGPQDAGSFQIVASNAVGVATSQVVQVVVRCVNIAGLSPAPPFTNWASAATNIQTAIDAASVGDIVLVTNGVYDFGGRVMSGDLTNRIALDKALIVMSVNGPTNTLIVGTPGYGGVNGAIYGSAPNGSNAVRCAWLADGAILSGFTLHGGGTRVSTDASGFATNSGGGVWCASQSALVSYCVLHENSAYYQGGGAYGGTLNNCTVIWNAAGLQSLSQFSSFSCGGGVCNCNLNNCLVTGNQAGGGGGGGVYGGVLNNCTVVNNAIGSGIGSGAGARNSVIRNSILWDNKRGGGIDDISVPGSSQYSCSGRVVSGTGNITNNPLFLYDGIHISSASPCRGAGSPAFASGTDYDGQTWTNPPSMGCDEWLPEPLLLGFKMQANSWGQFDFVTQVAGIESSPGYWFKNGSLLTGSSHYVGADSTHLTVKGISAADTGDYQLVVSNAFGMTTSRVANVVVHFVNAGNPGPSSPYTNWATAASRIQDAIDAALREAGLQRISFSLDSLDRDNFKKITGRDGLAEVLESIRLAQELDFAPVKVNAVVIRGINDHEIESLAEFARERNLSLRFIEFMPLDSARAWLKEMVVTGAEILKRLQARSELKPVVTDNPSSTSKRWSFADGRGEIGIIAPVSEPFCGHCNRIRLTADGKIRTCLFSVTEHDLRSRLRAGAGDAELNEWFHSVALQKEARHHIGEPEFVAPPRSMSCIGG